MLTACDGCSSSTVLNKVGTFISQVSCECQSVCFLYFSFVSLITACYLNASVFVNATFNRNFNSKSLHVNITMLTCLKCTSMPLLTVFSIIDKKKDPFHFAAETVRHTKNINSEDLLGPGQ